VLTNEFGLHSIDTSTYTYSRSDCYRMLMYSTKWKQKDYPVPSRQYWTASVEWIELIIRDMRHIALIKLFSREVKVEVMMDHSWFNFGIYGIIQSVE
jgi:hypothetical protein